MAKCLSLFGERWVVDAKGIQHDWANELSNQLIGLQDAQGSWKNTSERWYEEIPMLATSFAVVALVECATAMSSTAGDRKAVPAPSTSSSSPEAGAKPGKTGESKK